MVSDGIALCAYAINIIVKCVSVCLMSTYPETRIKIKNCDVLDGNRVLENHELTKTMRTPKTLSISQRLLEILA
jgi:hypothetical protein